MATKLKEVDAVVVGLGWTGGILSKELAEAGLKVVALERGGMRSTANDYSLPGVRDELRYVHRHDLMQNTQRDTLTIRSNPKREALPMRQLGSLPGEVVGGSGVLERAFGADGHGIQGAYAYEEHTEEHSDDRRYGTGHHLRRARAVLFDRFEHGGVGQSGQHQGGDTAGGNPFSPAPASTVAAAHDHWRARCSAAKNMGYHAFPRPSANASRAYTNPDGSKFGECQYCGFCQRFGCEANAKGSAHMTVIPIAMRNPNFELRTHSWVTKVLKDGKRVTGVTYTNVLTGEEYEQPAGMVLLTAYAINNVHLMLLSGIGGPRQ
jgi:gluconate 2-dehydrogenase alpha chain